ncbi:hypothetical protein E5221_26345 [Pseudomonas sp. A2]|nr:hypothetical protein E5221_26345 [Pseudomonas sp. A2]
MPAWANSELDAVPVGAALCRERAAQQPRDICLNAEIAGAAAQPFRDTRPLLQRVMLLSCRRHMTKGVAHVRPTGRRQGMP